MNHKAQMDQPAAQPSVLPNDISPTLGREPRQSSRASRKAVLSTLVGLAVSVCLFGTASCTTPAPTESALPSETAPENPPETMSPTPSTSSSEAQTNPAPGQQLPISAKAELGGQEIFLEVAATREQQALGLMYRPALPADRGMLFPFSPPRPVSFWMMNVPVPLDMVFVHQGKIKAIAESAPPCTAEPCPTYGPPGRQIVDYVIELRAGRAAELGLSAGDTVTITPLETPLKSPTGTP
ncbi:MAG TPA: DUF192 domain-containing protein [Leptolyngbyaceae cyanobacterium]